jgi:hypothetical protein
MIVKGKARSGPAQLAAYLMRTNDGERPTILDHGVNDDDLYRAFMVWDAAGEGTRGEKTLYHAQIAPEARYKMTPEQYLRAAEILAEDLGMANHPRRVILHDGGDKPHAHVVFQRTNLDTMTLWDDSFNYVKHERASKRMALEFGQELVPGKHANRDRKKQKDFPRQKFNQDDHQQAERTGMTLDERKAQITGIRKSCDDAPAFRNALEEAGYVLAKGDKRGFVLVDQEGEVFSLSKHVTDIKGKEYKSFMAPIDPATLPAVEEAKILQQQRQAAKREALTEAQLQPADLAVETPKAQPEAPQAPGVEASKFLAAEPASKVEPPAQTPEDAELAAIKKALAERQAKDVEKWADYHAHELRQLEFEADRRNTGKLADRDAADLEQTQLLKDQIRERHTGIKGIIDAIENRWNPRLGAEKAQERRREIAQLKRRQAKERKDYAVLLEQVKQEEIAVVKERQALQRQDVKHKHDEEKERYLREHQEAKRILADIQAEREELERNDSLREGPPPPKLGK